MSITVEIGPEVQASLAAQAAARGMDMPSYVAALLEEAVRPGTGRVRRQSLSEFLLESPLAGSELDLRRDEDSGRTLQL